jgi:glucose-1-phosphate adenylyltransferase
MSNRVVAMILAGGQGERLSVLSRQRAKPAVPFGGKYRIIDFALSNCVNSGIYNVAVLTQYRPHSLNQHIGTGRPWDLDRNSGGVRLLQPYLGHARSDWYRGTADAFYHNLWYVEEQKADLVLILSGDHIYRQDYREMIAFHQAKHADVTVAVTEVPLSEASRFGIMEVDDDDRILRFYEKPKEPVGTLASMGIYIFNRRALFDSLLEESDKRERLDFGQSVIPWLIGSDARVYAYRFSGYWQDVGTIQSYWEANMDLLADLPSLNLYDPDWVIHTRSEERPPVKIMEGSHIERSLLSNGCIIIRGSVIHSVLSPGVIVKEGAVVRDSIIMNDTIIGEGSVVDRCILDKEVIVGPGGHLGAGDDNTPNWLEPNRLNTGITIVGKRARLPAGVRVGRNCRIGVAATVDDFPGLDIPSGDSVDSTLAAMV